MSECLLEVCRCTAHMQFLQGPEEYIRPYETEVAVDCEQPCECWEMNPGPLARAASVLNHGAIPPALQRLFY